MPERMKYCSGCDLVKPTAEFALSRKAKDGLQCRCRACGSSRDRNQKRATATRRRWAAANPDRVRAAHKRWAERNPDALAAARSRSAKAYRARKAGAPVVEHVLPLVLLERDDGRCGICAGDVDPLAFHVDHIVPLSRGGEHSYANTQVAHPACNQRKGASLSADLLHCSHA